MSVGELLALVAVVAVVSLFRAGEMIVDNQQRRVEEHRQGCRRVVAVMVGLFVVLTLRPDDSNYSICSVESPIPIP